MRTANINISNSIVEFESPVFGSISSPIDIENTSIIDAVWFHLATEGGVHMISVLQHSINNQSFTNTTDAITYIESL